MAKALTPPEALHRAAALCSASEHCIGDIRQKLARWGIEANEAQAIIERLVQDRFIDEGRYAVAFAKDKFRFSGWGRIKIRYALQQKQISPGNITEAISAIDEEQYTARLFDLLEAKLHSLNDKDTEALRAKLFRFATSRGFESELIFNTFKALDL